MKRLNAAQFLKLCLPEDVNSRSKYFVTHDEEKFKVYLRQFKFLEQKFILTQGLSLASSRMHALSILP